jgi:hypothetical protein
MDQASLLSTRFGCRRVGCCPSRLDLAVNASAAASLSDGSRRRRAPEEQQLETRHAYEGQGERGDREGKGERRAHGESSG